MDQVRDAVISSLKDNPYFSAGAGLFGVGAAMAVLRRSSQLANLIVRRNFTLTLEVASHDKAYPWVLHWLAKKASTRPSSSSASTVRRLFSGSGGGNASQHLAVETSVVRSEGGRVKADFGFVPSTGIHYLFYHNRLLRIERVRSQQALQGASVAPFESVTLTTLGRNRQLFVDLLEEARESALAREKGWTIVYKAVGAEWRQFGYPRPRRPLSSVVLADNLVDNIVNDVTEFIENQNWYTERGIPYHRGYLLYGPPGCGKTSFITALAGHLDYSISVLNLSEFGMTADRLDHLLTHAPLQSIILLEDIDAAVHSRTPSGATNKGEIQYGDLDTETNPVSDSNLFEAGSIDVGVFFTSQSLSPTNINSNSAYEGMPTLTLSGLLNALDGVTSTDGRIIFMTTNFVDRLDDALIRPGRVDLRVHVDYCSRSQLARMFQRFYPPPSPSQSGLGVKVNTNDRFIGLPIASSASSNLSPIVETTLPNQASSHQMASQFASRLDGLLVSSAEIQGYLAKHKDRPDRALERLDELIGQLVVNNRRKSSTTAVDASSTPSSSVNRL